MMRQKNTKVKDLLEEIWERLGELDGGGVFLFPDKIKEFLKHLAIHC